MLIAQIANPTPVDYREAFPNTSFAESGPNDEFLAEHGYARVSEFREHDGATQKLVPVTPYYEAPWVYTVRVADKTADEIARETAERQQQIKTEITAAVQDRLDAFARTRGYDDIVSACSYATSTHPRYGAEGRYCVAVREQTWDAMFAIEADVLAGTRPMPAGYEDIEPELPALVWPE